MSLLAFTPAAHGWGRIGHRVSARLCETLLTPEAREAIKGLLDPGESLANASTWADEHRRDIAGSGPWHYVDVPLTAPRYDPGACPPGGCVVSKVQEFRAKLKDPATPRDERRQALRFLVHFVQDLHQPVHVGERHDRGGNDLQVQFFRKGSNLHRVWDSGLIEHEYRDEDATFAALSEAMTPAFRASVPGGTVEDWASESLSRARDAYLDPETDQPLKAGAKLEDAYQAAHLRVARRRVIESAVRLAAILNETFDPAPKP